MAFNINGLINNIVESVKALGGDLGIFEKKKIGAYPKTDIAIKPILSEVTPENWVGQLPYSFVVLPPPGSTPGTSASKFGEFELPINPSEITQDENPSKNFKITQGGTVIQNGGLRYKDLTISGTTGIHPFKGAGGAQRSTGKAIFQPDEMKYRSGYEVFLHLRNWFRAYDQFKATDPKAKGSRLVFRNFKDGEFLIVELVKFTMKRSASRPKMYDYMLNFRVLGHVSTSPQDPKGFELLRKIDNILNTAMEYIDTARGIFLRSQDIIRQVESTYEASLLEPLRKASLAIKALLGVRTVAADMGKKAISSTVSAGTTLATLLNIDSLFSDPKDKAVIAKTLQRAQNSARGGEAQVSPQALVSTLFDKSDIMMKVDSTVMPAASQDALTVEQQAAQELPSSFYEDTIEDIKRIRDNCADKFNLSNTDYDSTYDRTPTLSAEPGKIPTDAEVQLLYGFTLAIKGLEAFLSSHSSFKSTYAERIEDINSRFEESLGLVAQDAVREIFMPANTDLERLALQELGDITRWVEIAELNQLKPPYVVQDLTDSTPNVLKPGSKVLIPAPVINGFGSTPRSKETYFTENLSEIERNLGVDLRLTPEFDLEMTNRGDLQLVYGTDNAAQAIILNLLYEKGDLMWHPDKGVGLEVGNKFPTLNDVKTSIINTLAQDPRFDGVLNLRVVQDNSEMRLKFDVKLKNVDIPVPIDLRL